MDHSIPSHLFHLHSHLCPQSRSLKLTKKQIETISKMHPDSHNCCTSRTAHDPQLGSQQLYSLSSKEKNICQLTQKNTSRRKSQCSRFWQNRYTNWRQIYFLRNCRWLQWLQTTQRFQKLYKLKSCRSCRLPQYYFSRQISYWWSYLTHVLWSYQMVIHFKTQISQKSSLKSHYLEGISFQSRIKKNELCSWTCSLKWQ